jgi:multiple sugar transport system ATP-binding protein
MAEVIFQDVVKRFGEATVIPGLCLAIRDREFMVLVGPSGCGKSTALRMLAGLEEVTGGTITIGGRPVNDLPPKSRDIAMVFQSYALYPHMTVRENIEFGLRLHRTPREEMSRRVAEAAEMLGLEELLGRRPRELSGGQRQRVAVGRAIVRKPAVFLFDEPLSNLDAKLRVQMRAELARLQQRLGTTTVYVTHDQVEAMTMGHRLAVMSQGRLMQVGTPREVYERPESVFVGQFIGTPPMNLVRAEITDGGRGLANRALTLPVPRSLLPATAGREGLPVIVGLRAEHLVEPGRESRGETASIEVEVEVVEPLGHEVIAFGRLGLDLLAAKLEAHRAPRFGERLALKVQLDALHLFEAATEKRLVA